jgi:hypothetical protein
MKRPAAKQVRTPPLGKRLVAAALEHNVDYDLGGGKRIPIPLIPVLALSGNWLAYAHVLSEAINRHLRKMPAAWFADDALRKVLVIPGPEAQLIRDVWDPSHAAKQVVVSRNDFDMPEDPRQAVAFESNGCAIGGIWYGGACARAGREVLLPDFGAEGETMIADGYDVFIAALRAQAAHCGVTGKTFRVGLLEDRSWDAGITEMPSLQKRMTAEGWTVVLGDPRELKVSQGFKLGGERVDVLYRNMEMADFVAIEQGGTKLKGLREAFHENRIVSGVAGDFDQKALWEVLTSKRFERHVDADDRTLLRTHLLWTRLLREVETENPKGESVDLVKWAAKNRTGLVLKPNLLCGGEGVSLGPLLSAKAWEKALANALKEPGQWVVQKFHKASSVNFKGVGPRYVTCGMISGPTAVSALGRASTDPVVNVSRGGGLVPLFKGSPRGPGRTTLG